MSRTVRLGLGGAVLAAVLLLAILARPEDKQPVRSDPHGAVPAAELARLLRATDAASSGASQAELEAEGRRLFNSTAIARNGESCGTCHTAGGSNGDLGTVVHSTDSSKGLPGGFDGPRNAPALWDVAKTAPYAWDGSKPTLEAFAAGAVRTHNADGASLPDAVVGERAAALAAYLRTIKAPLTANDRGRLSEAARRGEELFVGKGGCIGCHGGPQFTDNSFHIIIPRPADTPANVDCGVNNPRGCPPNDPFTGAFNTPTLRNISQTAPYFHNGSKQTLRDVVNFYNSASTIAPLSLTDTEIDELVEYLKSL